MLPPCPERPPGVETCQTWGSCGWSPPWAEDLVSLERTGPSWSPDAQSSYTHIIIIIIILLLPPDTHTHCSSYRDIIITLLLTQDIYPALLYFSDLLWIFSSIDLAQKALISKSTPQACRHTHTVLDLRVTNTHLRNMCVCQILKYMLVHMSYCVAEIPDYVEN